MLRESTSEVAELRQSLKASESESMEEVQALNEHMAELQNGHGEEPLLVAPVGRLRSELRAQQDRSRRAERAA
eukprot:Skav203903  [mRNA]  locus=scaffold1649:287526:288799:- [translate_table: standard]